jgi:hypothetical protein
MNIFSTDEAKKMLPGYAAQDGQTDAQIRASRSLNNLAVNPSADTIMVRALRMYAKQIAADPNAPKTMVVTTGGTGAGKTVALTETAEGKALTEQVGVIVDTAGELNATQLPLFRQIAEENGLQLTVVHVHNDPTAIAKHPQFSPFKRGEKTGRMTEMGQTFSEAHALSAQNVAAFKQQVDADPNSNVDFLFFDMSKGKPQVIPALPAEALEMNAQAISVDVLDHARAMYERGELSPELYHAAVTDGERMWE